MSETNFNRYTKLIRRNGQVSQPLASSIEDGVGDSGCDAHLADAFHTQRIDVFIFLIDKYSIQITNVQIGWNVVISQGAGDEISSTRVN